MLGGHLTHGGTIRASRNTILPCDHLHLDNLLFATKTNTAFHGVSRVTVSNDRYNCITLESVTIHHANWYAGFSHR